MYLGIAPPLPNAATDARCLASDTSRRVCARGRPAAPSRPWQSAPLDGGDDLELDPCAESEAARAEGAPGGQMVREVFEVDRVHLAPLGHIREHDRGLDHAIQRGTVPLEDRLDVGQRLAGLGRDPARDQRPRPVDPERPRQVQDIADTDGLRERHLHPRNRGGDGEVLGGGHGQCSFVGIPPRRMVARTSLSMLPPLTTQTMVCAWTKPSSATATEAAPAPSATTRERSARVRTADATAATDTTREPASSVLASGHMSSNPPLPPIPSTKLGVGWIRIARPAASDAARGAAVSTSAA